jgi:hypothetical protein
MQPEQSKSNRVDGRWWRASKYQVLRGEHYSALIAPAADASINLYDPWKPYRALEHKSRSQKVMDPPYLHLMELGRLPLRSEAEPVLDFANQFGLLGSIPVTALSIRFPRTEADAFRTYLRQGGCWAEHAQQFSSEESRDEPISAGITRFGLMTLTHYDAPLETIQDWFPGVELSRLPLPNTPEFFAKYAEPLWDFLYIAKEFRTSVGALSAWEGWDDPVLRENARRRLSFLSQSAAPSFEFSPERRYVDEERKSAGLLASYALMFLWDLVAGRRVFQCQVCGRLFVSDDRRAQYCSRSHRLTASSRRYRTRPESSNQGESHV